MIEAAWEELEPTYDAAAIQSQVHQTFQAKLQCFHTKPSLIYTLYCRDLLGKPNP